MRGPIVFGTRMESRCCRRRGSAMAWNGSDVVDASGMRLSKSSDMGNMSRRAGNDYVGRPVQQGKSTPRPGEPCIRARVLDSAHCRGISLVSLTGTNSTRYSTP